VVENDVLVRDRNAGCLQVADGPDDAGGLQIAIGIVILAYDQDAGMVSLGIAEQVVVILREENSLFEDAPVEVGRSLAPPRPKSSGSRTWCPAARSRRTRSVDALSIIQVQFHRCVSQWCSSGDSTFGAGWYL
jgi:hypothetical protein